MPQYIGGKINQSIKGSQWEPSSHNVWSRVIMTWIGVKLIPNQISQWSNHSSRYPYFSARSESIGCSIVGPQMLTTGNLDKAGNLQYHFFGIGRMVFNFSAFSPKKKRWLVESFQYQLKQIPNQKKSTPKPLIIIRFISSIVYIAKIWKQMTSEILKKVIPKTWGKQGSCHNRWHFSSYIKQGYK